MSDPGAIDGAIDGMVAAPGPEEVPEPSQEPEGTGQISPELAQRFADAGEDGISRNWRNNNPGNIKYRDDNPWTGKVPGHLNTDGTFEQFFTPEAGVKAMIELLLEYRDMGYDTIEEIVSRWAPPSENDTERYIRAVEAATGIARDAPMSYDRQTLLALMKAKAAVEARPDQRDGAPWGFTDEVWEVGFSAADPTGELALVPGGEPARGLMTEADGPLGTTAVPAWAEEQLWGEGWGWAQPAVADPEGFGGSRGLPEGGLRRPEGEDDDSHGGRVFNPNTGEWEIGNMNLWLLRDAVATDPETGDQVNLIDFIVDNELTDEWLLNELMASTQWAKTTSKVNQQFDWDFWEGETQKGQAAGGEHLTDRTWYDVLPENYVLDPKQAEMLQDALDVIERTSSHLGMGLDEDQMQRIAFFARRNGLTEVELRRWLADEWAQMDWGDAEAADFYSDERISTVGTLQDATRNSLLEMGRNWMIPVGDVNAQDNGWVRRVLEADDPETELGLIESQMRQMATDNFPTLKSYIDGGMTPGQFFAPYVQRAQFLLERPIDLSGKDYGLATAFASTTDDKGMMRPMTWGEAERYIRSTDEWQYTDNAYETYSDMVHNIARIFGEVA